MNPALKQAHLQTAQCQPADQSLQKSLLFHPERKTKNLPCFAKIKSADTQTDLQKQVDKEAKTID